MIGTWDNTAKYSWLKKIVFNAEGKILYYDRVSIKAIGQYSYEGDVLIITDKSCVKNDESTGGKIVYYSCSGTYRVYLSKDGNTPIRLRFELIDDPSLNRVIILTENPFLWVEQ